MHDRCLARATHLFIKGAPGPVEVGLPHSCLPDRAMDIAKPYLLFLGNVHDQLAAKTAQGIVDWRRDWCVGQLRLEGCKADTGLKDVSIAQGAKAGAKTLLNRRKWKVNEALSDDLFSKRNLEK
mgnify:CR=1 FL=1